MIVIYFLSSEDIPSNYPDVTHSFEYTYIYIQINKPSYIYLLLIYIYIYIYSCAKGTLTHPNVYGTEFELTNQYGLTNASSRNVYQKKGWVRMVSTEWYIYIYIFINEESVMLTVLFATRLLCVIKWKENLHPSGRVIIITIWNWMIQYMLTVL